jgi:hypothetical protein
MKRLLRASMNVRRVRKDLGREPERGVLCCPLQVQPEGIGTCPQNAESTKGRRERGQ